MKKKILGLVLLVFLCSTSVWAAVPELTAIVNYTEPTTQSCTPSPCTGKPLTELQHSTIYFEVRDVGGVVLDQWTETITATASTGGGDITYNLPPRMVTEEAKELFVWASASNPIGESVKAGPEVITVPVIDLTAPSAPVNLNVTITIQAQISTGP